MPNMSFWGISLVLWLLFSGHAFWLGADTALAGGREAALQGTASSGAGKEAGTLSDERRPMPSGTGGMKIVAGSSLVADIVLDLADGGAEVKTLVPGSSCPGHEAVKTTDLLFAAEADLILVHAFQRKLAWFSGLTGAGGGGPRVETLETEGNWLVPEVQKEAVREVAGILGETFPAMRREVFERARKRLGRVDAVEREALERLAPLKGAVVGASEMQAELVRWAGFRVPVTFGRPEELQPMELVRQTEILRESGAVGVVDNVQSGADAGLPLALELGVPHAVLSGFPGFREDVPDYVALLRYNVKELLKIGAAR